MARAGSGRGWTGIGRYLALAGLFRSAKTKPIYPWSCPSHACSFYLSMALGLGLVGLTTAIGDAGWIRLGFAGRG